MGLTREARSHGFAYLLVVTTIDTTHQELDKPQVGRQVERRVGPSAVVLLDLKVGRGVDQSANLRVLVQLLQELACALVVADLSELNAERIGSVPRALQFLIRSLEDLDDRVAVFSAWRTIRDCDDQDGLLEASCTSGTQKKGLYDRCPDVSANLQQHGEGELKTHLEDLLLHGGAERSQAAELGLLHELIGGAFGIDVVSFNALIEPANLDAVLVKERGSLSDLRRETSALSRNWISRHQSPWKQQASCRLRSTHCQMRNSKIQNLARAHQYGFRSPRTPLNLSRPGTR